MQRCSDCNQSVFTPRLLYLDASSIREKLRSEFGPESVKPNEIAAILEKARLDFDDYDREIHHLEARTIHLATQRERLRAIVSHAEALLAPVRKLPNEILQQIFDDCCETNEFRMQDVERAAVLVEKPALVVSSVCLRWRKVATSFPSIWSRISLEYHHKDSLLDGRLSKILTAFLSRSEKNPVTLSIDISYEFDLPHLGSGQNVQSLSTLGREYQRWHSVTFKSHRRQSSELALLCDAMSLTDIHTFSGLVEVHLPYSADRRDLELLTRRAPNLKSLTSKGVWEFPPAFPLSQLTHLQLDVESPEVWKMIQEQVLVGNNLLSLDVVDFPEWLPDDPDHPICSTNTSTRALTVRHFSNDDEFGSMFPLFTFPSLETLRLENGHDDAFDREHWWHNFDPFMAFAKRSSFSLTTLFIQCLALSDSDLVHLLSHVPTLLDFTFIDTSEGDAGIYSPLTEKFIESLHAYRTSSLRRQTAPLIPRLRYLTLSVGGTSFKDGVVVDMIRSRWVLDGSNVEVDCLRSFTLQFRDRTMTVGAYDALDHIEKDGMRVVIAWNEIMTSRT